MRKIPKKMIKELLEAGTIKEMTEEQASKLKPIAISWKKYAGHASGMLAIDEKTGVLYGTTKYQGLRRW